MIINRGILAMPEVTLVMSKRIYPQLGAERIVIVWSVGMIALRNGVKIISGAV